MSAKDEIENLQRLRAEELRRAYFQFARTRRDVRNALSPKRLIRRHPDLAVAAAAAAGMWLAPDLGHRSNKTEPKRTKNGPLRSLLSFFRPRHSVDTQQETSQARRGASSHLWARVIFRAAFPLILHKIKESETLHHWLETALHGMSAHARGNGHSPADTSAPAGDGPEASIDAE